jgi:hypothetical protein
LIGIFLFAIISLFFDKKWNWGRKFLEMGRRDWKKRLGDSRLGDDRLGDSRLGDSRLGDNKKSLMSSV